MSKAPAYLWKNRFGVFYFRLIIPPETCYKHGLKREVKKSLRTTNRQQAIALARTLKVQLEETMAALEPRPSTAVSADSAGMTMITLKKVVLGAERSVDEIVIQADTPEQEAHIAQQLLSLPQQPANLNLSLHQPAPEPPGPRLSLVIDEYSQEHISLKKWRGKTIEENRTVFK